MRVALDVRPWLASGTGVSTYTRELALGLARQGVDLTLCFATYHGDGLRQRLEQELMAAAVSPAILQLRVPDTLLYRDRACRFWTAYPRWLPAPRLLRGFDLYHAPFWPLPLTNRPPMVLTVHDLLGLRHPDWAGPALPTYQMIRRLAPRARRIIADSEATRDDVLEFCAVGPEQVTTVPLGVTPDFYQTTTAEEAMDMRAKYGLDRPYVVCVGVIEPRKNVARLIDAYDRLPESREFDLVLAGPLPAASVDPLGNRLTRDRVGRVRHLSYVAQEHMRPLYAMASALMFVSLYEGFGLPPLEAMAAGCPVVAANNTSLPEVVGDAALLVTAEDTDAITEALRRVVYDEALAKDLRIGGRARAAQFSWERTARETAAVYATVVR